MMRKESVIDDSEDWKGNCTAATKSKQPNRDVLPPMEYCHHLYKNIQHLCDDHVWRSLSSYFDLEALALNAERMETDCFCLGRPFHYNYISRVNDSIKMDHNHQVSNAKCNTESNSCNEFHRRLLITLIYLPSEHAANIREIATLYDAEKCKENISNYKCSSVNNNNNNSRNSINAHSNNVNYCIVPCHAKLESVCETDICNAPHDNKQKYLEIIVCGKYHTPVGTNARSIEVYEVYTLPYEVISTKPELAFLISQMCTLRRSICNNKGEEIICRNNKENVSVDCKEPKKELLYCEALVSEKLLELLYKNQVCSRTLCRVTSPMEEIVNNTTTTTALVNNANSDVYYSKYTYENNSIKNSSSTFADHVYNLHEKHMLVQVHDNDEKMYEVCHAQSVTSPIEECMISSECSEESNGPTSDDNSVDCTFASIQETSNITNPDTENNNVIKNIIMQPGHNASRVGSFISSSSSSSSSSSALHISENSETTLYSPFSISERNNGLPSIAYQNRSEKCNNKNNIDNRYHSLGNLLTKEGDCYESTIPCSCTVEELLFSKSTAHTRCRAMTMSSLITNNKFYNYHVPIGWSRWAESCEELDRAFVVNLMDEIVHYCHCTRAAFYTAVGLLDHFVGVNHNPQLTTHEFTELLAHRATKCHYVKKHGVSANLNIRRNNGNNNNNNNERVIRERNHNIVADELIVDVSQMQDNYGNQISQTNLIEAAQTSSISSSSSLVAEVSMHQEEETNVANRGEEEELEHHNKVRECETHSMGVKTSQVASPPSSESIRAFFTQVIAVCCMLGCKFTDTYPPHVSKIMLCLRADNCFIPDAFTALELFVLETLSYTTQSTTVNEVVDTLLDLMAPHFVPTAADKEVTSVMAVHDRELHYSKLAHKWATTAEDEAQRLKQIHEWFNFSHYSSSTLTCNYNSSVNNMVHECQEEQRQLYFVAKQWNMFASVARYLCDEVIRGKRMTLPVHRNHLCTKKEREENSKLEEELMWSHDMNEVHMPFLSSSPCELGIAIIRAAAYFSNFSLPPVLQKLHNSSYSFPLFCVEYIRNFHVYQTYHDNLRKYQCECNYAQSGHTGLNENRNSSSDATERKALLLYFAWLTATVSCHVGESCGHNTQSADTSSCTNQNMVSERINKLERDIYECFRDAQVKGVDNILHKRYSLLATMFKQN